MGAMKMINNFINAPILYETYSPVKPPSRKGAKHSEESKAKMRQAALNRKKKSEN